MFGSPEDWWIFSGWSQQLDTFYLQQLQQLALDTLGVCVCVCMHLCVIGYAVVLLFVSVSLMSLLLTQNECVCVPLSHSMRVLDRCSGSAVVVISLHVG